MSFGYDALNMLSGERTWRSIRRISTRLLDDLKRERASAAKVCDRVRHVHIYASNSRNSKTDSPASAYHVRRPRHRRHHC